MNESIKNKLALIRNLTVQIDRDLEPKSAAEIANLSDERSVTAALRPTFDAVIAGKEANLAAGEIDFDPPWLQVGRTAGRRGSDIDIDVTGHTIHPITGLNIAIGWHPDLAFKGWSLPELSTLTGLERHLSSAYLVDEDPESPGYSPGRFVQAWVAFMRGFDRAKEIARELDKLDELFALNQISKNDYDTQRLQLQAKLKEDNTVPLERAIPVGFPLIRIHAQIRADATPGRVELVNRTKFFGNIRLSHGAQKHRLRIHNVYTTSKEVSRDGLHPNLISGYVDILE